MISPLGWASLGINTSAGTDFGAFSLGLFQKGKEVFPIAIKYSRAIEDAFS